METRRITTLQTILENENGIKSPIITEERLSPVQMQYTNTSDEVKRVSCFEIFNKNPEGIEVKTIGDCDMDFMKKYFYENPHLSSLFRFQSPNLIGLQSENMISVVSKNPMGQSMTIPAILLIDCVSKNQFQGGIIDVPYSFVFDGLTRDLEFDLLPNSMIVMTVFFSQKLNGRSKKGLKELNKISYDLNKEAKKFDYVGYYSVENLGDVSRVIDLNDEKKYNDEYSKDETLKFSDNLRGNYGFNNLTDSYFNSMRIVATCGAKQLQVISPIEFNSGNKYYPAVELNGTEFQSGINDIGIFGEDFSSENTMRVTIMPKTRVIYLFRKQINTVPHSVNSSFINIESRNLIDGDKKVNIMSSYNPANMIIDGIYTTIGKNKINLTEHGFRPNVIRINFFNNSQVERDIVFKETDANGQSISKTINPVEYINENLFQSNVVEFKLDFGIEINDKTEIIFDFKDKGDGVNVVLYKSYASDLSIKDNSVTSFSLGNEGDIDKIASEELLNKKNPFIFPLWIENKTDESIQVELVNNIEDFKGFPKGIKCNMYGNDSYELLLKQLSSGKYESLFIDKIYTKNPSEITQIINICDYNNPEKPIYIPIITQSYFSAMQFQSSCLNLGGTVKMLDLQREEEVIDGEGSVDTENNEKTKSKIKNKQKLVVNILPKTKVAYVCRVI